VTVNSGRGLPGEFGGSSNRRVKVGAAAPLLGEVLTVLEGDVSSAIAFDTKFFNPGDIALGEPFKKKII